MTAQVSNQVFAQIADTAKKAAAAKTAPAKKSAAKKVPAKTEAKTTAKTATKPATKVATVKAAGSKANVIKYGVHNGFRPGSGAALFAYTQAWLQGSGLLAGGSISKDAATKIAGATAIAYHAGAKRFAISKDGQLTLTASGLAFFNARSTDKETVEAYLSSFKTGKPHDKGIKQEAAFMAI